MVSLSNNSQGNVNITTNNGNNVNLRSNNDTDINANMNGNAQRAKSWAVGEGLIDGVDYSAKYWAEQAKESEDIASHAIEDIDTAKDEAIAEMETAKDEKIDEIQNTAADFEDDLEALTTRAETAATNAETSETNAATSATSASTSATNASNSATSAATNANLALGYKNDAYTYADLAGQYKTTAEQAKTDAQYYRTQASGYASQASNAATGANKSATYAQQAQTIAEYARDDAANYAQQAQTAKTQIEQSLVNYYTKSETYSKTEVNNLIASIPEFTVVVVQTLPQTGEAMTLYLVPKDGESPDVYNEYIWVENQNEFELIGSTAVDLDGYATELWVQNQGYATETYVDDGLADKQNTLTAGTDLEIVNTPSASTVVTGTNSIALNNAEANTLQNVTVSGVTEQRALLTDYQRVQYLESTDAGQYIDLGGVFSTATDDIEVKLQLTTLSNTMNLVGARNSTTDRNYNIGAYGTSAVWRWGWKGNSGAIPDVTLDTNKHTFYIDHTNQTLSIDGVVAETRVISGNITTPTTPILFGVHATSATLLYLTPVRIYEFKKWRSGELVQHLIPCRRISDNELGMYDYVTGDFLTNAGDGDFVAGADITNPTPDNIMPIWCNNGMLKVSGNLLNRDDLEGSYLLTDEGQKGSSNDNWILTNFIKVKPNTSYIFDFVSGGDSVYRRVCGYSTNDYNSFTELLVKKQRPVTEGERFSEPFTTSATTNYIKVSTYKADTNIQITEGTEVIPYRAYGEVYADGVEVGGWQVPKQTNLTFNDAQTMVTAFGSNKYVAINQSGYVSTSTDGITWSTFAETAFANGSNWTSMAYGNNKFVAVGYDQQGQLPTIYVSTSTDGITWTTANMINPLFAAFSIVLLTYTGQEFVIFGCLVDMATMSINWAISTSTDGVTWTTPTLTNLSFDLTKPLLWDSLVYGNGKFVILGGKGDGDIYVSTSTDGITWTIEQVVLSGGFSPILMLYNNGNFIALLNKSQDTNFYSITSTDGLTWSNPNTETNLGDATTYRNFSIQTFNNANFIYPMMLDDNDKYWYITTYKPSSNLTETVTDSVGNSATAEMLLNVTLSSNYTDTQEILTGAITRNTAIKVLNGTENWIINSGDYNFYRLNSAVNYSGNLSSGFYCTHFKPSSVASTTNNQGIRLNGNAIFLRWDELYPATSENLPLFKQWLANQYASGTPIVLVYPITTAETETVIGQTLNVQNNTNTLTVTGALNNLPISATYTKKETNTINFTNDSQYITNSALNGYATETWVGQQGYITGITSSDVTTALGYTPYNSTNPNGYTSNVGTVTSVNNTQPDANGNVSLTITSIPPIAYGTSTTAAATAQKEVSIPEITALKTGQIIVVQPTITSTVANSTLKLNNFDAYPMRYSNAAITTSTDSTVWSLNYPSQFVFDGTYWVFLGHGTDTNTTYTINYSIDAGAYKAGVGNYAITRYSLCMQKPDMSWEKVTATSATYSTATSKSVNTNGFILGNIRYYNTTAIIANGANTASNTMNEKAATLDLRYSTNCGATPAFSTGDYIYFVGTMGVDGLFYLDTTTWWTNTLPSTNDGKLYVQLGKFLADSNISLYENHPAYYHDGNKLCEYKVADNKQNTLVSGTNIKTVNNTSLLGSGNIDTSEVFIAEYGTTTYANVLNAYNAGKTIIIKEVGSLFDSYGALTEAFNSSFKFYVPIQGYSGYYYTLNENTGWARQIVSFADTDLSNLSSTGKEVIDGQWVDIDQAIISSATSLNGSTNLTYRVDLPNDGHKYEVMIRCNGYTGSTSGNEIYIVVSGNEETMGRFACRARNANSGTYAASGTVICTMSYVASSGKNLTVLRNTSWNGSCTELRAIAYRRIGTNT